MDTGGNRLMATATTLPTTLRDKLALLARRIRLLRALRGTSLLILTLVLIIGGTLLLDLWLDLPRTGMAVSLGLLAGLGLSAAVFGLIIPLCRRLDADSLAAIIEEKYPELGERLTSTVELADNRDIFH